MQLIASFLFVSSVNIMGVMIERKPIFLVDASATTQIGLLKIYLSFFLIFSKFLNNDNNYTNYIRMSQFQGIEVDVTALFTR